MAIIKMASSSNLPVHERANESPSGKFELIDELVEKAVVAPGLAGTAAEEYGEELEDWETVGDVT